MVKTLVRVLLAAGLLATGPFSPLAAKAAATALEPGTISLETSSIHPAPGYTVGAFVEAVTEVLANRGYTILEGHGHARLVAELFVTQVPIGTANAKVPPAEKPTIAGRGVSGEGVTGAGGSLFVPLPSGKVRLVSILQTRLEVRIKKLGEDGVVWSSAALTVRASNSGNGRERIVAADLAKAIFQVYPAQPDSVIAVP